MSIKVKSAFFGSEEVFKGYFYLDDIRYVRENYEAKYFGESVLNTPVIYYNNVSVKEKLFGYMVKENNEAEPFLVLGIMDNNSHVVSGSEAAGYVATNNVTKAKEGDVLSSQHLNLMTLPNANLKNIAPKISFFKPEEKESLAGSVYKRGVFAPQYEIVSVNKLTDKTIYNNVKETTNQIVSSLTNINKKMEYNNFVKLNLGGKALVSQHEGESLKR